MIKMGFIACSIFLVILCGVCVLVFPWYYLLLITLSFSLSVFFLVKYKVGTYLLVLLILIFGKYLGLLIDTPGATIRDVIPVYTPIYFFLVVTFIIHKITEIGLNPKVNNPLNIPIYILFSYSILTIAVFPTGFHLIVWFLFSLNIGLYYFIVNIVNESGFHRRLMWFWVGGGNILAVLVIVSILVHPQILYEHEIFKGIFFVFNYAPDVKIRGYAIGHPNHTSMLLNMVSSIILGMFICEKRKSRKLFFLLSLGFCIFANFLTMSKAGIGSMWVMMHFIILCSSHLRKNFLKNVAILNFIMVILFIVSFVLSEQVSPRILEVSERGGYVTSAGGRLVIWKAGFEAMVARSLLPFGLGPGGFDLYTQFPHAHSLYLSFFFDFGVIGLLCILLIMAFLFREFFLKELNGILLFQKTFLETMSLTFFGGLIAISIHGIVDHTYIKEVIWIFAGFAVATLHLSRTEKGTVTTEGAGI